MSKHKTVTKEDRDLVKTMIALPQESMEGLSKNIESARLYLKEHIEESGIFGYAAMVVGGKLHDCINTEYIMIAPIYSELNQKSLVGEIDPELISH